MSSFLPDLTASDVSTQPSPPPTRRKGKAYEEVAQEQRGPIVNGERSLGDRLPNETAPARRSASSPHRT